MLRQRHPAASATQHEAAPPALDKGGAAPPVEKKYRLLFLVHHAVNSLGQRPAEDAAVAGFKLFPHINNFHTRHGCTRNRDNPFRQGN
jgi:hypothetical protein